ncbi:hypothetical protein [Acidovorax facilis]|jgi:hypothetical protein|uniref:hypothetical protein n=1 Tax=Acidovorax facilis TaxID=12917 RepID=UPI003D64EAB8
MTQSASTVKNALIAEMLGDIDSIMRRIEQYPELLRATHVQMGASVQALERAGAEYRVAASVYTDAAKSSLQTFANQKAEEILAIQSTTQAGQDVTSTLSIKQAILASAALSSFLTALAVLAAQRLS